MTFRQTVRELAGMTGLTPLYLRLSSWRRMRGAEPSPAADETGVPVPPLELMARVVGHADWRAFLKEGEAIAHALDGFAEEGGVSVSGAGRILDLGCGSGRVIRHLPAMTKASLYGVDVNAERVRWCSDNLEGSFTVNQLTPPLDFPEGYFDVVYLISVFTHLRTETQRAWLGELQRIVKPGGVALASFHDEDQPGLPQTGKALNALKMDGVYIQNNYLEGSNFIAAYQTRDFTEDLFGQYFDVIRIAPRDGSPIGQATAILRRR